MLPLCCWSSSSSSSGDSPHRGADLWQQHQQQQQQRRFICKHSAHVTPFGSTPATPLSEPTTLPMPFAIHAGSHHNATASSKKLGSAMSHSARQNHLKRPAIITYDRRPTRTGSWQDISCISVCQDIVARFRCSIERERDCSIQNTKYPFYLHISYGSSSSTFARNGEKFHFLIYLFSLPTTR